MENIILSMWIFAGSLQIAFLVALIAIAQTLRRSFAIQSPYWIVLFFCLKSLGQYADPFLVQLLIDERTTFTVTNSSFTLGQLFAFLSSAHLIFILLGAFGLLALVLADLSHSLRGADDIRPSRWFQCFELVGRHRLGFGLATVLLAVAHPALLVGLLLSSN